MGESTVQAITADGKIQIVATATGPATDVSVGAGASVDITLTYAPTSLSRILEIVGVRRIMGLPDGIVLQGIHAKVADVILRVRNHTGAPIAISAGSVIAEVAALGI